LFSRVNPLIQLQTPPAEHVARSSAHTSVALQGLSNGIFATVNICSADEKDSIDKKITAIFDFFITVLLV